MKNVGLLFLCLYNFGMPSSANFFDFLGKAIAEIWILQVFL